jgi:hypothetical protein
MGLAGRPDVWALHIGKGAGAFALDSVDDLAQRTDLAVLDTLAGTIGLRPQRLGGGTGAEQEENKKRRKIPHRAAF